MPTEIKFAGHAHTHDEGSPLDGSGTRNQLTHRAVRLGQTYLGCTNHGRLGTALDHYHACRHPEELDDPLDPSHKRSADERLIPVIGLEAFWRPDRFMELPKGDEFGKNPHNWAQHLCLHARSLRGWHTLKRLSSKSWVRREQGGGFYGKPCVDMAMLKEDHEDIVVSTACLSSPLAHFILAGDELGARRWCKQVMKIVGPDNLWFEIMPHDLNEQRELNIGIINLADSLGRPIIGTGDVHCPYPEWIDTQSIVRMASYKTTVSKTEKKKEEGEDTYTEEIDTIYLTSGKEMYDFFRKNHPDIPKDTIKEALSNTHDFFTRFRGYQISKSTKMPIADEKIDVEAVVSKWMAQGRAKRNEDWKKDGLSPLEIKRRNKTYDKRQAYEFGVLKEKNQFHYFYLVGDLTRWLDSDLPLPERDRKGKIYFPKGKKKRKIRYTTRGSAAGSLISYDIKIVKIDPIQNRLLFERFLNPDRVGLPDIDLDVESGIDVMEVDGVWMDGRALAKEYLARVYGRDHVADVIAYQTFSPKAVIRAVAETQDLYYERDIKPVTKTIGDTERGLEKIAAKNETVAAFKEKYPEIWKHCLRLEDQKMRDSRHAAAMLITPKPVSYYMPTQLGTDEKSVVTAFSDTADFPIISDYGFVKLDVLGVKGLARQELARQLIKKHYGDDIDLDELRVMRDPHAVDPAVMQVFKDGITLGIFQSAGRGYTQGLRLVQPQDAVDLTAFNAIYRPGPIDNLDTYAARKNGYADNDEDDWYWHESVRSILEETVGVVAFQEQVMEVCKTLGNFTGAQADGMRKGISKWYRLGRERCIEKLREAGYEEQWLKGCQENGLSNDEAWAIWVEGIVEFAGYGFNRSHAAVYSIGGSYIDAWIKVNYPLAFYASLLTIEKKGKPEEQIAFIRGVIREARLFGVDVLPPDVNRSVDSWTIDGDKIRFGLAAIKDLGSGGSNEVLKMRGDNPFDDFNNFIDRMESGFGANKAVALVKAGAFDEIDDREELLAITRRIPENKAQFKIKMSCGCKKTKTITHDPEDESDLDNQIEELPELLECKKHPEGEVEEIEEIDPYTHYAAWLKDHPGEPVPDDARYPSDNEIADYEQETLRIPLSTGSRVAAYYPLIEERAHTEAEFNDLPAKPKKSKNMHGSRCACDACEAAKCYVGGEVVNIKVIKTKKSKEEMAFVDFAFGVNQYSCTFFPYIYKQCRKLLQRPTAFIVAGHKDDRGQVLVYDMMDVIDVARESEWEPPEKTGKAPREPKKKPLPPTQMLLFESKKKAPKKRKGKKIKIRKAA